MKNIGKLLIIACSIVISACAETGMNKTAGGAIAGGVLGAGTGAIIGSRTGDAGRGTAIGAGLGAVTGALMGNQLDKQDKSKEEVLEQQRRQQEEIERQRRELEELKRQQGYDSYGSGSYNAPPRDPYYNDPYNRGTTQQPPQQQQRYDDQYRRY